MFTLPVSPPGRENRQWSQEGDSVVGIDPLCNGQQKGIMPSKPRTFIKNKSVSETGAIRKGWAGRISVALVYPNSYHVGMSSLGFQTVYLLLNQMEQVVCERAFLSLKRTEKGRPETTVESSRRLAAFDIIAFSVSFENDYPNILSLLENAGIPLRSDQRDASHPLVLAGGVACFINPEPISPFIDCFLMGEAEKMLNRFFERFDPGIDKRSFLLSAARNIPSVYVPAFYDADYNTNGTLSTFVPVKTVPPKIERAYADDLSTFSTCSAILTKDTTFDETFLIEVSRGCPHGCRFCSAGFIYRPPRFRPVSMLQAELETAPSLPGKIGLVGSAVSDLPGLYELCSGIDQNSTRISFSSLRADAIGPELISVLKRSKVKTATLAPDAGSQRMRNVINKGITEDHILGAAEALVAGGVPNLKLYFLIGLPTETLDDVNAIVTLCKQIKHRFLKSSRTRKQIGEITVSLNSFVPKPFTPFQWVSMNDTGLLKKKIKCVKDGLKRVANVRVHTDVPRWAYIQALLSRGDRKVAGILSLLNKNKGNWAQTLKESSLNSDFYVYRERDTKELLPWDFIDQGIKKTFLEKEYRKAREGRTSSPCPVQDCAKCGVCRENPS